MARRIKADLSKQAPNNSYAPPLYYEDKEFTCADCGRVEIWTAEQQQWWYETAKGPIYSTAVRCRACRQARRETPP
jgi:Probable zinc-ribbon domain